MRITRSNAAIPSLALLLPLLSLQAHAQLEVSWAYTVQGIGLPYFEYWHGANSCAVDRWGNVAIAGYGWNPVTMNTAGTPLEVPHTGGGMGDGFVGRYRSDGTPAWGFWLGGAELDGSVGVDMDNDGNVYLSFMFEGSFDMDSGPDTAMIAPADGDRDLAIIKYDSTGHFLHALHLVSAYNNPTAGQIERMGFDADNNLYIAGFFHGGMDIDPDTTELLLTGNGDQDCGFVAKYDPEGHLLQHLLLRSTSYDSEVMDLVVDPDGSIFITGTFSNGLDLDMGPGTLLVDGPGTSCFAARFHPDFSPQWGTTMVGGIDHLAFTACSGVDGGYIFNGQFRGDVTVTLADGTVLNMNGGFNESSTFIAALSADGEYIWFKKFETGERGDFFKLAAKDDGSFYGAFHFFGDFNMDPGASNYTVSTSGFPNYDMGIVRYNMVDGAFQMGHAYTYASGTFPDVEVFGSALYLAAPSSGWLHPDIPAGPDMMPGNGMALIKYCHVPENLSYSVVGDALYLCSGADSSIIAYGADQFAWYDQAIGGLPIATGDTLLLIAVDASRTVYVEGINGNCVSERVPIEVVVRPQVQLALDSISVCAGDTVLLDYDGLGDIFTANVPTAITTGYVPPTSLALWVTATDLVNGCTAVDTAWVEVLPLPVVSLALTSDTLCLFGGSLALDGEDPPGGSWAGEGVVNDSTWSPFESGPGAFMVTYTVVGNNGCAASAMDGLVVDVCFSGIADDMDGSSLLSLSPSPATDHIMVRSSGASQLAHALVLDAQGRLVHEQNLAGRLSRLELGDLSPGRYLLRVRLADGSTPSLSFLLLPY